MTKKPPKESEKEPKRKQTPVKLNTNLLIAVKEKKDAGPHFWKTLPRFIEDVLQEEIKEVDGRAIVHIDNKKNNNNLKTNNWRFKEEFIKGPLLAHKSLVVEFWLGKGGSKNHRSWQLLEKGCLEILGSYGPDVLEEQIKLGIANKWKSLSLANYESFKPIKRKEEKELDFEAMDNAPSLF
jgi:hypothetical protein